MDRRLNYGRTFLLGFGFFGISVIWSVYNAYVPIFLANKFNLAPAWIGFFMTLDNIAAFLIQPSIGAWSDRLRTPIGRRMPFILVGAPIGAAAFGLIPMQTILPLFVACTSTLLLSMALWRTPVVALMPDITPSRFRSQANGIINFMGGVGSIIAFLFGADLYDLNPSYPFWLGSVLVIVSSLLVFAFIREPKEYETTDKTAPNLWHALREVVKAKEKSPLRILLAIFFWFVAYNAIEAFFTLFAVNHLGMSASDGARLLGQLSLLFVIMALPAGYIGGRFGRRNTILIGIILLTACMVLMFFIPQNILTISLGKLPVLGNVPVRIINIFLPKLRPSAEKNKKKKKKKNICGIKNIKTMQAVNKIMPIRMVFRRPNLPPMYPAGSAMMTKSGSRLTNEPHPMQTCPDG